MQFSDLSLMMKIGVTLIIGTMILVATGSTITTASANYAHGFGGITSAIGPFLIPVLLVVFVYLLILFKRN